MRGRYLLHHAAVVEVATVCSVEKNVNVTDFTPPPQKKNGAILDTDSVRTNGYLQNF